VKEQFWFSSQLRSQFGSLLMDQLYGRPYGPLRSQLRDQLGGLLYSRLGDPLKVQLREDLEKKR